MPTQRTTEGLTVIEVGVISLLHERYIHNYTIPVLSYNCVIPCYHTRPKYWCECAVLSIKIREIQSIAEEKSDYKIDLKYHKLVFHSPFQSYNRPSDNNLYPKCLTQFYNLMQQLNSIADPVCNLFTFTFDQHSYKTFPCFIETNKQASSYGLATNSSCKKLTQFLASCQFAIFI